MSIEEQIQNIQISKELIRQAIESKGVPCDGKVTFREYSNKIQQIQNGGTCLNIKSVCDKVVATCQKGTRKYCVVQIIAAVGGGLDSIENSTLDGTYDWEFSDGYKKTDVQPYESHELTSIIEESGYKYYWVKVSTDSLDYFKCNTRTLGYAVVSYDTSKVVIETSYYSENKCLKHLDFGEQKAYERADKIIQKIPTLESFCNADVSSFTDFYPSFENCTLTDLSFVNGAFKGSISVKEYLRLNTESVDNMIANLGEGDGFMDTFEANNLTEEQKSALTSKGWNYY